MIDRSFAERIVLGTAQLGSDYGIMNKGGKPIKENAYSILETAWQNGVRSFDTAPGYQSERLIGDFIKTHGVSDEIIILTKVPSLQSENPEQEIFLSIENSIEKLGCQISVLFLHDPKDATLLIDSEDFFKEILINNMVMDIGVSVYDPTTIKLLNSSGLSLAFQFPFNLLDRRFENIKMNNGKRYARSIFLQGILSSDSLELEEKPIQLRKLHQKFHDLMEKEGLDPFSSALNYVACHQNVDYFLIGVDNENQLKQTFQIDILNSNKYENLEIRLNVEEQKMLDPRNW